MCAYCSCRAMFALSRPELANYAAFRARRRLVGGRLWRSGLACAALNAARTAAGCFEATSNKARAGPCGSRRACSQLRSVPRLTPMKPANSGWDRPSSLRMAGTSTAVGIATIRVFSFICPRRQALSSSRPAIISLPMSRLRAPMSQSMFVPDGKSMAYQAMPNRCVMPGTLDLSRLRSVSGFPLCRHATPSRRWRGFGSLRA